MGEPDERLLKLSAQIADGAAIDWNEAQDLPAELREQLRQIELLAGGFQSAVSAPESSDEAGPLTEGERFGPLQIRGLLGRGSFGHVYRAYDAELDREVALKLVAVWRGTRDEILREARLMARIDHANVLKVFGALEDGDRIGFAFELIEGETMESWIGRHGALGPHAVIAIGLELGAALCALHQGQILHGDLKPGNILRHSSGRWIVADFGSGQYTSDTDLSSGTPRYMAPELFGNGVPSAASDQYALAVVLFRLASQRFPVEGDTAEAIAHGHVQGMRLRLLDLRPDLPMPMIAAIERALDADPAKRFASVGLFAAALSEVIAERPRTPIWRSRAAWLAVAAALLLGLGLFRWTTVTTDSAELTWISKRADGSGRVLNRGDALGVGDGLALELQLDRPRHVYVINQDQTGARFQLFPLAAGAQGNPLNAGQHVLPGNVDGESVDWRVTSRGGREYFLVVLSDLELPELSELQLAQASAEDAGMLAMNSTVRGVGGLRERAVDAEPDWSWLAPIKARYPHARFEIFELSNP